MLGLALAAIFTGALTGLGALPATQRMRMFGAQLAFPFIAGWLRGMAGLSGVFQIFGAAMLFTGGLLALRAMGRPRTIGTT